jgi:hypothetical protein
MILKGRSGNYVGNVEGLQGYLQLCQGIIKHFKSNKGSVLENTAQEMSNGYLNR